jgi:hypothetical protein
VLSKRVVLTGFGKGLNMLFFAFRPVKIKTIAILILCIILIEFLGIFSLFFFSLAAVILSIFSLLKNSKGTEKERARQKKWAMLRIVSASLFVFFFIFAIFYFGDFMPTQPLPEKCTFPLSLSCTDWQVNSNSLTLNLQNRGRDMIISSIAATSDALSGDSHCSTGTLNALVRNGDKINLNLDGCNYVDRGRDKNRYLMNLTYRWVDSLNLSHQMPRELLAKRP